ncbi:MAG: nucleotidyltransferase family protein [Clostridiales bacterium]|jgi:predicted nucleotidyltransferase|nr:nucleotidyltransferase family protein [Clostridiales bacterium]
MPAVGVVAEYNPFHNGHAAHIKAAREMSGRDAIVVAMSGNFTQRGEPAIADKWSRARMALICGADIVLEIPVAYATASAEFFASASIKILRSTGVVDSVCFGSECGDIVKLQKTAEALAAESDDFTRVLKDGLDSGLSYHAARKAALYATGAPSDVTDRPNDILGVEYLKAIIRQKAPITAYAYKRKASERVVAEIPAGATIVSAASIREAAFKDISSVIRVMPPACHEILKNSDLASIDSLSGVFHYTVKTNDAGWLGSVMDMTEGLENRIARFESQAREISDIISLVSAKRYAKTKISRAVLHCVIRLSKEEFALYERNGGPQYTRVLGFKKSAAPLLAEIVKKSVAPIVTNMKKADAVLTGAAKVMLRRETLATDVYYLATGAKAYPSNAEYTKPIVTV